MDSQSTLNGMAQEHPFLDGFRVIHLHPTLRCNLRCQHCYSSSAPNLKDSLEAATVLRFLEYAQNYGFDALSISGGEPFLYRDLLGVVEGSKALGYKNSLATNAMLLKSARAQAILEQLDLVAVSIDGTPALHDHIRQMEGAYERMMQGVALLRQLDKAFGFIHTVTSESWTGLIELATLAKEQGARLLQLHPLELHGRAQIEMGGLELDQLLLHKVFILGDYLKKKHQGELVIQLDFSHREYIKHHPQTVNYFGENFVPTKENLAAALKTVIVDEVGDVYPISYGFSKQYKIGNIEEVAQGVDIFGRYLEQWEPFYAVLKSTYHSITQHKEKDLFIWTERIVHNSYQTVA